ncbi:hypothetical protein [Cyanobium gracile]|uniref:Uncharacterized protein n=1 Tax=Cyanobium gracile UHCC 0281 TaxID=3110309 RepID=A0ABU5SXQ3_9CYAN|nr:hypothetical protein [Cyanobium gracile]MEA5443278.1 hypothetical protein [Cyanobium gracile UHCC 0281]
MNRIGWPTASELRLELAGEPPADCSVRLNQLRWIGRYCLVEELETFVGELRSSPHWGAPLALEVSLAWLLAGQPHQADLAVLEADDLDPSLGLVPDLWGLWPAVPGERPAEVTELAARIRQWRRLDPRSLDASWRQQAQADWTYPLTKPGLDELILLLRHEQALNSPIEPFLASLVGEELIAVDPSQAYRFWALLTDLRPDWDHARLKATDLALGIGDRARCAAWIATASPDTRRNPWYWDIAARSDLEAGAISTALDHWGQAIAEATPELAEVFRQRRREARRGPGVLHVRSLLDSGDASAALTLLLRLVADDPQWQPLRSLLQQAEAAATAGGTSQVVADQALQRFRQLLERAAARLGLSLPPAIPGSGDPVPDLDGARQRLGGFSRFLSEAEAQFALEA